LQPPSSLLTELATSLQPPCSPPFSLVPASFQPACSLLAASLQPPSSLLPASFQPPSPLISVFRAVGVIYKATDVATGQLIAIKEMELKEEQMNVRFFLLFAENLFFPKILKILHGMIYIPKKKPI
jgi:hypothetical protein